MATTTAMTIRIDTDLKNNAENILKQLGLTPTSLMQMLYSQIVIQRALPFSVALPPEEIPISIEDLTDDELRNELEKGINCHKRGHVYSLDEFKKLVPEVAENK